MCKNAFVNITKLPKPQRRIRSLKIKSIEQSRYEVKEAFFGYKAKKETAKRAGIQDLIPVMPALFACILYYLVPNKRSPASPRPGRI